MSPVAKTAVLKALSRIERGSLELVCPGETWSFGEPGSDLRATIVIEDERFFGQALLKGEIGFGESYVAGEWTSPDLVSLVRLAVRNLDTLDHSSFLVAGASRMIGLLQHWTRNNSLAGSRRNIQYHYDVGNEFYGLFLGSTMAYSCGFFESADDSLDRAQFNKFDRICRKLRLSESSHILEIGTGWGGFAIHAASAYGCRVTTTTISRQQYEYAKKWISRVGLSNRIELLFQDYRTLLGAYDHIVSIEMFEAVGYQHYNTYFAACDELLKPQGTMLLQTITMNEKRFRRYLRDYDWIKKHVFPGAELASLRGILDSLVHVTNLSLYHAEDIGAHYARTLHAWRKNFHDAASELPRLGFSKEFIRLWDYYLGYCEGAFLERHIGDFQLLLTRNHNSAGLMDEPWGRTSELEQTLQL
jgi:cyclopropane-fatty-acyl-phospholipid synthase